MLHLRDCQARPVKGIANQKYYKYYKEQNNDALRYWRLATPNHLSNKLNARPLLLNRTDFCKSRISCNE